VLTGSHHRPLVRYVAKLEPGPCHGPTRGTRLIAATADPKVLKPEPAWFMAANLSVAEANAAGVYRICRLRDRTGHSCKPARHELGWADFQVRSEKAATAAAMVHYSTWEPRPGNAKYDHVMPTDFRMQPVSNATRAYDPRWNTYILGRITGHFTGTTDQIFQWAATMGTGRTASTMPATSGAAWVPGIRATGTTAPPPPLRTGEHYIARAQYWIQRRPWLLHGF
jgi:hypothetical protein